MTALRIRMIKDMQLRGFSERTQEAYVRAVRQIFNNIKMEYHRICLITIYSLELNRIECEDRHWKKFFFTEN